MKRVTVWDRTLGEAAAKELTRIREAAALSNPTATTEEEP